LETIFPGHALPESLPEATLKDHFESEKKPPKRVPRAEVSGVEINSSLPAAKETD
jgi:hypothetical protein